jgi:hypothetical protein
MSALSLLSLLFTSPRLRGEVGSLAIRVRGSLHTLVYHLHVLIAAPHPIPLRTSLPRLVPARAGRGSAATAWSER